MSAKGLLTYHLLTTQHSIKISMLAFYMKIVLLFIFLAIQHFVCNDPTVGSGIFCQYKLSGIVVLNYSFCTKKLLVLKETRVQIYTEAFIFLNRQNC